MPEQTFDPQAIPSPIQDLHQQTWKGWSRLKAVERLSGLASIRAGNRLTRRLVRKTQDGTLGREDDMEEPEENITVGDTYHSTTVGGKGNSWWPLIVGVGMAAAGLSGIVPPLPWRSPLPVESAPAAPVEEPPGSPPEVEIPPQVRIPTPVEIPTPPAKPAPAVDHDSLYRLRLSQ